MLEGSRSEPLKVRAFAMLLLSRFQGNRQYDTGVNYRRIILIPHLMRIGQIV
jgi:hypothetical protein